MSGEHLGVLDFRPTYAVINKGAIRRNFHALRDLAGGVTHNTKMMPSIKANGYGHGLVEVAETLQQEGTDYLGVAFIEEAIQLRRAGITTPILVFGGLPGDEIPLFLDYGVDITASSVSKLEKIDQAARAKGIRARVHLKIDTGLERIGVHYYSCQELFDRAKSVQNCDVVGVYSHFASVEPRDRALGETQLTRFLEAIAYYDALQPKPYLRHISASSGILGLPHAHLDMVRPGLAIFGVYPDLGFSDVVALEPALSLKSEIVYFKVVKAGAGVSYSHRWHAPVDTRVVTVPIGYGDGYLRGLSNKGSVIIRGKKCPVVGSVCMDQLMVDIGPTGEGYNGDEVVLIGEQSGQVIRVEELAQSITTTPHEIITLLNQRVPRRYVDH